MDDLEELAIRVKNRRSILDGLWGEARATLQRGKDLQIEIESMDELLLDYDRVSTLLNTLGEERQLKAQQLIEELVTRGLQTIFDETLSFHIVQSVRGKTANVEFLVRTTLATGVIETPVMESRGGGLAAVIGFLLRVIVMMLDKGTRTENIMILDETFAHVSEEYLGAMGEFLREIVDKTGIQIVMVTHSKEFTEYADKVYRFSQQDGKTIASEDA